MQKQSRLQVDFLHGGIMRPLFRFMLPVLLSMVFQQLYNTTDTIIIGYTLGETALAAMGSASAIYDVSLGFVTGMAGGIAIMAARSWGAGDESLLKRTVASSLIIGLCSSAVITMAALFSLRPLLTLLNTPAEVYEGAYVYVSTIASFYIVTLGYNMCSSLLRSIGNSVMPLVFLVISSVANIGLDYFCIVRLGMGIRGAAVATVLSQFLSVVLCVVYILRRVRVLIPRKEDFVWDRYLYGQIITQGISMGLMSGIVLSGTAVLQSAINGLGYLVAAGHVAARKLFSFVVMISFSMMQAVSTFVSQNFGAGQISRIRRCVKQSYLFNLVVYLFIAAVIWFAAPALVRMISGSQQAVIIDNGTRYLRFAVPCMPVLGVLSCTRGSLQAIGEKVLPVFSSVIELVGKIVFVWLFIPKFGYDAVIVCEPAIWLLMDVELLLSFWLHPVITGKRAVQTKQA